MTKMKKLLPALVLFGLPALSLAACGVGGTDVNPGGADAAPLNIDCDSVTGTAAVEVGRGTLTTGFVVMTDGSDLEAALGPQGLFMVVPAVRTQNFYPGESGRREDNPEDPMIEISSYLSGSRVGGSAEEHMGLTPKTAGDERLGIYVPFDGADEETGIGAFVGQTVTLTATVTDACGNVASGDLSIVVTQAL